jgi:AcrR family transcriptional regulator
MPTRTWERLPAARRDAVLAAAEAEFGANGFFAGSLNVIAREAGVSKGSLFQYFADKADLLAHLADVVCLRIRAELEPKIRRFPWDRDFFGALRRFGVAWVRYFAEHPVELALTTATNLEIDPASRTAVRTVVNRHYLDVLRPLIRIGIDSEQLGEDADVDALLALLMLVLPHLAITATSPELDAVLGLGGSMAERERSVGRLVAALEGGFGKQCLP